MKSISWLSPLLACFLQTGTLVAQNTSKEITESDIRTHVQYLASDQLEGRAPGTPGNEAAASYIASNLERFGLQPAGDHGTFFQQFEFVSGIEMGQSNSLIFSGSSIPMDGVPLVVDKDFRPLGFSSNGKTDGVLAFAGYGISAPEIGYDDYGGLDVTGKVVVVFRYAPGGDDPHSEWASHRAFRTKARVAREHGAAALLIVTGPRDNPEDELVELGYDRTEATSGIPVVSMKREHLNALLASHGINCDLIQDSIQHTQKPLSFALTDVRVRLETEVHLKRSMTSNVVGYLPGLGGMHQEMVLVIGAHMDHLGWGGSGSGSLDPDNHAIHNGADDNASGTAGLLELAERFAAGDKAKAGILFVAFSAEELGTLGSAYYVEHPVVSLDRTMAMINMDMIGRLRDRALTIYGTGTSPEWKDLLERLNRDSLFSLNLVEDGYGPSDHAQFYGKEIPVLFFFTGSHDEYHKPGDDWSTLNYSGTMDVLQVIYSAALEILSSDDKPRFSKVQASARPSGDSGGWEFKVTLGVIPDYSSEVEGMKIGGVRPGGPAEEAGFQSGDIIVGMKGKRIMNIYDYMDILGSLKAGEKVGIEVIRGDIRTTLSATMQARK